jgi:hypothetical protein
LNLWSGSFRILKYEFLQKLASCIERGDLDACVEGAARVAKEMGVGAGNFES